MERLLRTGEPFIDVKLSGIYSQKTISSTTSGHHQPSKDSCIKKSNQFIANHRVHQTANLRGLIGRDDPEWSHKEISYEATSASSKENVSQNGIRFELRYSQQREECRFLAKVSEPDVNWAQTWYSHSKYKKTIETSWIIYASCYYASI